MNPMTADIGIDLKREFTKYHLVLNEYWLCGFHNPGSPLYLIHTIYSIVFFGYFVNRYYNMYIYIISNTTSINCKPVAI